MHLISNSTPSLEILQYLFDLKCDPNQKNNSDIPLSYLVSNPKINFESLEFLLKQTKDELKYEKYFTNLCQNESINVKLLRLMIEHKFDPSIKDNTYNNCIHYLCANNNFDIKEIFFVNEELMYETSCGNSPLNIYLVRKKIEFSSLKFFLENKSDINFENFGRNTSFHYLMKSNIEKDQFLDSLRLFFEYKADPNITNKSKETPFSIYSQSPYLSLESLKLFLENKANFDVENKVPIIERIFKNNINSDILNYLISQNKIDINSINNKTKNTFLHLACSNKNVDVNVLSLLIEKKLDINSKNNAKESAIYKYLVSYFESKANEKINMKILFFFNENGFNFQNDISTNNIFHNISHYSYKNEYAPKSFNELITFYISNNSKIDFFKKLNLPLSKDTLNVFFQNGTIWDLNTHIFFPPLFKKKIFFFLASLKFLSFSFPFYKLPKPILYSIIKMSSIVTPTNQKKRKRISEEESSSEE